MLITIAIVGTAFIGSLLAPIIVGYKLDALGLNPFFMFLSPHNAYVVARGRRDVAWRGLRIRVGPKYVIDADDDELVSIRPVEAWSPSYLGLALSFRSSGDSSALRLHLSMQRCAAKPKGCIMHTVKSRFGEGVCLERPWVRDAKSFALWQCFIPGGIQAYYFGDSVQCAEEGQIVLDAFASTDAVGGKQLLR